MISYKDFGSLRLADFYTPEDDIEELEDWEFQDRLWVGESVGFTEWLRLKKSPRILRSMALDLPELPDDFITKVLGRIELPLRPGMTLAEITAILGEPTDSQKYVADRQSYDFTVGDSDKYNVNCTVHQERGLIYLVVMTQNYRR